MNQLDVNILNRIIGHLDSYQDFWALILTCSNFYSSVDRNLFKHQFSQSVLEYQDRMYQGEHFELPNGLWHGLSIKYDYVEGKGVIRRECLYEDGVRSGLYREYQYFGRNVPQTLFIHNNFYFLILEGTYFQDHPIGVWKKWEHGQLREIKIFKFPELPKNSQNNGSKS